MPVALPAIAELGALLALLIALGLILVAHSLVSALFRVTLTTIDIAVGWIPWLGKKAKGGVLAVEHRLNKYLSEAATAVEAGVAQTWHVLAHTIVWLGYEIAQTAYTVWRVAWYVEVKYPLSHLWAAAKYLYRNAPNLWRRITHVEKRTQVIVKVIENPLGGPIAAGVKAGARGIDAGLERLDQWTRSHVAALEDAVTITLPHELDRLRAGETALERAWKALRGLVRRHERLLGAGALTAAVAFALARLGATWVRCGNWRRIGRRVCGMDSSLLDDLLAGTLAVVGAISLVAFAKEMQDVVAAEADAMRALIRETRG